MNHPPSAEQESIFNWMQLEDTAPWERNLLVRARAGTGKTTTIVAGVARAPERRILLAAFNRIIAEELQGRVKNPNVKAQTLHSLGFSFVRRAARVQLDGIGDRARDLTRRACAELKLDPPKPIAKLITALHSKARDVDPWLALELHDVGGMIEFASRFDLLPSEEWEAKGWKLDVVSDAAIRAMRIAREPTPVIDFADMVFLPIVNQWITSSYDFVVVDEAQDMTIAQLTLAVGSCTRSGRICVVGDDRQAIYGFRGADSGALDRLKHQLGAVELGLTTTYRCGRKIVEMAAQIVPDYKAAPNAEDGVIDALPFAKAITQAAPGDFVLSRKNAPLIRVCMELLKRNVPATVKGKDVGAGIIALIERLAPSSHRELMPALARWCQREVERARERLADEAAEERVAFVLDQAAIVTALDEGANSLDELKARCDYLFSDKGSAQQVTCSSVHKAKGLEADNVFMLQSTFRNDESIEEQNIRYVAITRAKRRLVLVEGEAA